MSSTQKPRLTSKQRALFVFLRDHDGEEVREADILAVTGWSDKSWRVYRTNGLYSPFLVPLSERRFRIRCGPDVTDWAFYKAVTQTKIGSRFAPRCKHDFARALALRSRDNMILALELYNRPSLKNRIDGFALLFCAAWEQLLKAEIVEDAGEETIYRKKKSGRPRETISLREAIDIRLDATSLATKNLEYIIDLRDKAAHLLMPEVRSTLGYLFQAGILNYAARFCDFTGEAFVDDTTGLVSLVGADDPPPTAVLMRAYGDLTGAEIGELVERVRTDIEQADEQTFAISVKHRLVLTKKPADADIRLSTAATGASEGVLVEREVATEKRYPYRAGTFCPAVVERTKKTFNGYDLNAVCLREGWTKSDNEYHRLLTVTGVDTHLYSEAALEWVVQKLSAEPEYMENARVSLRHARRKLALAKGAAKVERGRPRKVR